jgi:hypothetical protein
MRISAFLAVLAACSPDPEGAPDDHAGPDAGSTPYTGYESDTGVDANVALCPALGPAPGSATVVSSIAELEAALLAASPGDTIAVADGEYAVQSDLWIRVPSLTLTSAGGDRGAVILDGEYLAGSLIHVEASNVTVRSLTLKRPYYHAVHVAPADASIHGVVLTDLHVVDPGEQAIKVNTDASFALFADEGMLSCSHLELTAEGRENVRNNCYTGGLDAHQVKAWQVFDNAIEGFWCADGLSEHAIHFWRGGRDNVVQRNAIRNCARGIGLGLGNDATGRTWPDAPCGGAVAQDYDGVVGSNTVFADDPALFASQSGFDVGIGLESACGAAVVHNTVASTEAPFASIDLRFEATTGDVANNLASHPIVVRDGARPALGPHREDADAADFVDLASGDLHLVAESSAIGAGAPAFAITDIDGDLRIDGAPDLGADER